MVAETNDPKPILPFMGPVYAALEPLSYFIIRASLGFIIIPHGYEKLFLGAAQNTARNQVLKVFGDPIYGAYFIGGLEFFGGIALLIGLFTRFFAAAFVIEMMVISFAVLYPNWAWTQRGMEYALFMGLVSIGILIRGGGPFSLDRAIGREL